MKTKTQVYELRNEGVAIATPLVSFQIQRLLIETGTRLNMEPIVGIL